MAPNFPHKSYLHLYTHYKIYKLFHPSNPDKILYIGYTARNLEDRMVEHRKDGLKDFHIALIAEYSKSNTTDDEIRDLEQCWILIYDPPLNIYRKY